MDLFNDEFQPLNASHNQIIDILNYMFKDLDAQQLDLLCYFAYTSPSADLSNLERYIKYIDNTQSLDTLKKCAFSLVEDHFLISPYYSSYFYSASINGTYVVPALYYLITKRSSLYTKLKRSKISVRTEIEYLCQVIQHVSQGIDCKKKLGRFTLPANYYSSYYNFLFFFPKMRVLAEVVHPKFIYRFISYAINYAQASDLTDYIPLLEQLYDNIVDRQDKTFAGEALAYARYCYDGTYKEIPSPSSYWGYILNGLHLAFSGDNEAAADSFAKGFNSYNKEISTTVKNAYALTLPAYFCTICFARGIKPAHKNRFATLSSKYNEIRDMSLNSSRILTLYYEDNSLLSTYAKQWCKDLQNSSSSNGYALCQYVANYLGLTDTKPSTPIQKPAHKILVHEMRSMFSLSQDELNELNTLYGDKPLFEQVKSLKPWEITLDKVLRIASTEVGNKKTDKSDSRLIYIASKYQIVEVCSQSRLKSGVWGKPHVLSLSRIREIEVNTLNSHDLRVRSALKGYNSTNAFDFTSIMPALVGCDRVFVDVGSKLTPAIVDEDQPYLLLEKTKNGEFQFTSNIKLKDIKYGDTVCVVEKSRTHFSVIKLSNAQLNIFLQLLQLPSLPAEAEPVLRNFLSNINPKIGIHSSSIEGAETLNSVQGDPEVVIRIYPANDLTFTIELLVKTVKGGSELFSPGNGDAIVVDMVNGERCQVMRKISRERTLAKNIRQFVEDLTDSDFSDAQLQAQQMLELIEYVKDQPEYCIEWPKGAEIKLKVADESSWSFHMKRSEQWFDVEGEVSVDANTVLSLAQLLDAVSKNDGRFVKLNDNDYLLISESIKRQLKRLNEIATSKGGKVKVSPLQAAVDNDIFGDNGLVKVDSEWTKLRNKIIDSYKQSPRIPSALQAELRDYQHDGYLWLKHLTEWGGGACLADDMGLGKTVQAIAFLISEAKSGAALVVAPASVLPNWRNELARFAPSLNVKVLNNSNDRANEIFSAKPGDVVLTTYGLLISEEDTLISRKWHVVCLDEAHTIKNRDTKMSKVAMRLYAEKKLALTGTPIQNHLGELWNLFQFLNPGLLGSHEQFQQKYITPIEVSRDKDVQRQLKRTLAPFMLRRTKKEVADELPDKTEIKISVDLTNEETAIYETLRVKAEQQLQSSDKVDVNILSQITQLRRAACTPQLVANDFTGESSKLKTFISLVDDICSTGNKVLVFSQFTSFLKLAKDALDKVGVPYQYFDGSTTIAQREKIIEQFRNDDNCQLFLISLKAGGLGLNLTEANYVIHLDPWWNPAIEQQATDRAYRIGQKQKVTVYHLISAHTIEEKILRLHATKRDLADQLLEGTNVSHKITATELLNMLSQ